MIFGSIVKILCDGIFNRHKPEVNLVATMPCFEVAKSYLHPGKSQLNSLYPKNVNID